MSSTAEVLSEAVCGLPRLLWQPSPNFNPGRIRPPDLVVAHDEEGNYAGGMSWFFDPRSQVSTHLAVREDGLEATQLVAFGDKAWHACDFNTVAIGVEMAGFEARGFGDNEWKAEATIVAYLCKRFGIPPLWSEKGATPGFCRHFDLGAAGGGHTDPTQDPAIWARFVAQVQQISQGMELPSLPWGR